MDPFDVLGIGPEASDEEVAAAYRDLAKRHHPDVAGETEQGKMAQINVAYELLRAGAHQDRNRPTTYHAEQDVRTAAPAKRLGWWLTPAIRRALGPELLSALAPHEDVQFVCLAATWDSHHVLLAITDRRVLWLRDDAFVHRVKFVRRDQLAQVETRLKRPLKRIGELRLKTRDGSRMSFSELRPELLPEVSRRLMPA